MTNPEAASPNHIIPLTQPNTSIVSAEPSTTPSTPDSQSSSIRKIVLTDAAGNIQPESAAETAKYIVKPFPDNTVFRFAENPQKPGTYVLVDSENGIVAAAVNQGVAQILCEGALHWLLNAMKAAAEKSVEIKSQVAEKIVSPSIDKETGGC